MSDIRALLSRLDELHFLTRKAGIYEEVERRVAERMVDGEAVSGSWIMETIKALQIDTGIVYEVVT